ncbi:MAG: XrtA/PEP-CTERM system histidine kinase PrsK [Candidatus Eisenbacteria bacterium]
MTLQQTILVVAMASTIVPVVAVVVRGQSHRLLVVATLLVALMTCFHLGAVLHALSIGRSQEGTLWASVIFGSTLPLLLSGYLFSGFFGRDDPHRSLRQLRGTFLLLAIVGAGLLFLAPSKGITRYEWADGRPTIHLGSIGKAYLSFLLIGLVAIGYNLERTYRTVPAETRYRLRLPMVGFLGVLAYETAVLASGMLYSSIGVGKLIASSVPFGFASVALGHGYFRGALVDLRTPVSRSVIYSSFTALAAALFVLAIAAAAQIASWTKWSPDEILVVSVVFLGVLVAGLFLFSHRFQRSVRRYIDRNFYVNRYDYRTQWSSLTKSLRDATDEEGVLNRVAPLLLELFVADGYTISLRDAARGGIRPRRGKGSFPATVALEPESPLYQQLEAGGGTLLLDRKPSDLAYIPIYAEDGDWLDGTASQLLAPLKDGGQLIGTIGLERRDNADRFTFEDVALLDSIAGHVAANLRSMQLMSELREAREIELISQWSSMLLHDLKNHLAPLRMAASNLLENEDDPEIVTACARDIGEVADRMESLVQRLGALRQAHRAQLELLCPNRLLQNLVATMPVLRHPLLRVETSLHSKLALRGDRAMLQRVLENLVQNAVEAMEGRGTLRLATEDLGVDGKAQVRIDVVDSGCGISEEFLRDRLFRPFETTKKKGLGLGLYQCRTIVRNHGGELRVRSEQGKGSVFQILLQGVEPAKKEIEASR